MQIYNLNLPGELNLRLLMPFPVFDNPEARLLLGAYLPGTQFSFDPPEEPTLTIVFRHSTQQRVVRGTRKVTIYDQWKGEASLLDFIHLIYAACRIWWLQHDLYPVHSALVGDLLIVGHSGAGKTSTALHLAAGRGKRLFSSNKTLLKITDDGRLVAVGGTRTITTKAKDADRHLGGLADRCQYVGRSAFLLEERAYAQDQLVEVRRIAFVQLNDGADEHSELSPVSALHRLFPFFLDAVNANAVVCGGADVLSGAPPRGVEKSLAHRLLPALQHVSVCAVTGSMQFITTALEEKHDD